MTMTAIITLVIIAPSGNNSHWLVPWWRPLSNSADTPTARRVLSYHQHDHDRLIFENSDSTIKLAIKKIFQLMNKLHDHSVIDKFCFVLTNNATICQSEYLKNQRFAYIYAAGIKDRHAKGNVNKQPLSDLRMS